MGISAPESNPSLVEVDPFDVPASIGFSWRNLSWLRFLSVPTFLMIASIHGLALLALHQYFFSWSGLALAGIGLYVFGCLGINIGYHRLLTHRSFKTPPWFERFLCLLALCNLEGSPLKWVGTHRIHHKHADAPGDPHSPVPDRLIIRPSFWIRVGKFLWSHVGWIIFRNPAIEGHNILRLTNDLHGSTKANGAFYTRIHEKNRWLLVWLAHVLLIIAAGFITGCVVGGVTRGVQYGASWFVWGVVVRTVVVWHVTWSINSITHMFGYQNYETRDNGANVLLLSVVTFGESLHGNHHADQRSASNWHRWWEVDIAYLTIRLFGLVGLATDIVLPTRDRAEGLRLEDKNKKTKTAG